MATQEEEYKQPTDNTFAFAGKYDPSALNPSTSITSNLKTNTLDIQVLASQNKLMGTNKYSLAKNQVFPEFDSFTSFQNISLGDKFRGPTSNYFFDTFFLAYALHGQVVLSPDDIWLQICSEFAKYINANAEALRKKIVTFDGKTKLVVDYDETDPSFQDFRSPTFRWDKILEGFSNLINKNTIGEIGQIANNNFSTSGPIEQISGRACLMYACEKYFDYEMGICGCGIEKVHYLGERKDWESIKEKLLKLQNYDIDGKLIKWIQALVPNLDSFIKGFDGVVDLNFWNSIVHKFVGYVYKAGPSGMNAHYVPKDFINGWILDFFLFNKDDGYMADSKREYPTTEPKKIKGKPGNRWNQYESEKDLLPGVSMNTFPSSFVKVPVVIVYKYGPKVGTEIPVHFATGFSGVLVDGSTYRPQISFAVAERSKTDEENQKSQKKNRFL